MFPQPVSSRDSAIDGRRSSARSTLLSFGGSTRAPQQRGPQTRMPDWLYRRMFAWVGATGSPHTSQSGTRRSVGHEETPRAVRLRGAVRREEVQLNSL